MPWDITGMHSNYYFTLFDIAPRTSFDIKQTNLSFLSSHPPALDNEFFNRSVTLGQNDRQRVNVV